ncbi:MAG: hypothetical protein EON87_00160 [Brevundimonas sp.]|jgi:hypothetical protein|nr:MAG: hypothetical protein EON87_00160 [Brevundimonas sp.]
MVVFPEKSRRRLLRGALSFASPSQVVLQLAALASAAALGLLLANAARNTLAALVTAVLQSTPTDWTSGPALITTGWVLTFAGLTLLFRWGLSRALATAVVPLFRRRRFECEAYFGPGLKGQPRLDS